MSFLFILLSSAKRYGPGCPQDCELPPFTCTYAGTSEDCLTLDVYTPRGATENSNLPVLMFIHGGNYIQVCYLRIYLIILILI